jgi:putative methyltransferase (TIGR04325 family)
VTVRGLARALLPPLVVDLLRRRGGIVWSGDYRTWAEAAADSAGYDAAIILERVEAAALKVRRGEAAFERDGVLFSEIEYSWPLLAGLLSVAARHGGRLEVVDFGGALGSTYFQNRRFLAPLGEVRWNVVEQPHFVERGRLHFQDERLRFYPSLDACLTETRPNVLVLSSVLQYLEQPYEFLAAIDPFPSVIIDLTPVHSGPRDRLTVQRVPPSIYPARYPCWIFSEERLLAALRKGFAVTAAFESHIGRELRIGRLRANYRGYVLERTS